MDKKSLAHIELSFSEDDELYFYNLVEEIVPTEFFYTSPVISRIDGNVAGSLHCTLFYGIDLDQVNNFEIDHLIEEFRITDISLGKMFLLNGFEHLYKILCIEVLDEDKVLRNFSNKIASLTRYRYDFKPHLTLAYVKNDYVVNNTVEYKRILRPKSVLLK